MQADINLREVVCVGGGGRLTPQRLRHNRAAVVWFAVAPLTIVSRRSATDVHMYLALNLSLPPLDLLQLHVQVFVLRRQLLHAVLERAALLLGPSQLVAVNLTLCEQKCYIYYY